MLRRALEPSNFFGLMGCRADPIGERKRKKTFRNRVVLVRGPQVQFEGVAGVPVDTETILIQQPRRTWANGKPRSAARQYNAAARAGGGGPARPDSRNKPRLACAQGLS
jgi:hypothetical protein